MSWLLLPAGFVLPIAVGFAILAAIHSWCREEPRHDDSLLFAALVAVGLGLAVTSLSSFFGHLVAGGRPGFLIGEAMLLALGVGLSRHLRGWRTPATAEEGTPASRASRAWPLVIAGLLALAAVGWAVTSLRAPHGPWDAWAIWNLRARFLFFGEESWRAAFSPELAWSHPGYPLLLPLSIARLWQYVGDATPGVPALQAALFAGGTVALLFTWLSRWSGSVVAAAAALALLATPWSLETGSAQMADGPLAFFFLLAVLSLAEAYGVAGRSVERAGRHLALAGLFFGAAAWTKNEGLTFGIAGCLSLALFPVTARSRDLRRLCVGAAPFAVAIAILKLGFSGRIYLAEGQSMGRVLTLIMSPARHIAIWKEIARVFGGAPELLVAVALFALFVLSRGERSMGSRAMRPLLLLLSVQALCYYGVYLVTPLPLGWHVSTTCHRLFLHLWPAALLLGSLAAGPRPSPSD